MARACSEISLDARPERSERFRVVTLYFISLRVILLANTEYSGNGNVLNEMVHALAVLLSSY